MYIFNEVFYISSLNVLHTFFIFILDRRKSCLITEKRDAIKREKCVVGFQNKRESTTTCYRLSISDVTNTRARDLRHVISRGSRSRGKTLSMTL